MIVRRTGSSSFGDALLGDIGGVGLCAHGFAGIELPITETHSIELALRAAIETYFTGSAKQVGPMLSLRW